MSNAALGDRGVGWTPKRGDTRLIVHSEVKPWPQGSCRWGRGRPDPACMLSRSVVSDFVTPWSGARQAPLSMEFSRQEYWSGLPFPPQGKRRLTAVNDL